MDIWNTPHAYVKHSAKLPSRSFKEPNGEIYQNELLIMRAELPVTPLVQLSANVFRTRSSCFISDSYEGPVISPCVLSLLRHISSLCFCASSLCLSISHSDTHPHPHTRQLWTECSSTTRSSSSLPLPPHFAHFLQPPPLRPLMWMEGDVDGTNFPHWWHRQYQTPDERFAGCTDASVELICSCSIWFSLFTISHFPRDHFIL